MTKSFNFIKFAATSGLLALFGSCIHAQSPDSLWSISLGKFDRNDFHGVVEDMNRLTELIPGLHSAIYNRGVARLNLGDREGACSDMELARSLGLTEHTDFIDYTCDDEIIREAMIRYYYENTRVYPELGYRPQYTRADSLRGALRSERTCFDVFFYNLSVKIIPKRKQIKGSNSIHFQVVQPCRSIQIDLFDNLKIKDIIWNGQKLNHTREYNAVFVDFPEELKEGEDHIITVSYQGKPVIAPNPPWEGGFVWERDDGKNFWAGVACEHLGASCWWPNKDHLSDKPDSMLISLEVPQGYRAISNGDLRNVIQTGKNHERFNWFVSYPINNYNVTFYMGNYEEFHDMLILEQDTLMLDYYVLPHNLDRAREHFGQTRDVLEFYTGVFGDYPFKRDGFGLVESPYEGMEHQSAIAYGNEYENNGYRNNLFDYIIVHEAAHEWWGNSVSAGDMADLWIHEGFATYAEYLFLENKFGRSEYLYELHENSRFIFNIWPLVQNRDVNENTFASNDIYNKGAMMLHCLRCTINNDSLFFKIIMDYAVSRRYQVVNSDDFISFVNCYTKQDYRPFFNKFLYETRLPVLSYTYNRENENLFIRYRWTEVGDGFRMPLGIETDLKETIRLEATTEWNELSIPGASWFNFFNIWKGYEGCPANSFTYYRTKCENP
ncbi:MAG: M1 family metallopeptidase [Bacteroidales bacterium]|nr:M1 family metallopeptidase [Bacteroidales bacterium]